jgi:hypothetical protein
MKLISKVTYFSGVIGLNKKNDSTSMEHRPSQETVSQSSAQIYCLLWNPKVLKPFESSSYTIKPYFFKTGFNILLPSICLVNSTNYGTLNMQDTPVYRVKFPQQ